MITPGLAVLVCGEWRERVTAGQESKVQMSAFPPLSSQPGSGLCSKQCAGVAEEGAGRDTRTWEGYRHLFHVQNSGTSGLREHLPHAVASPAVCWYSTVGSWQDG